MEGTCISYMPQFQLFQLSKKMIFYWKDLWNANTQTYKVCQSIAHYLCLYYMNRHVIMEIVNLIPYEDLFKMIIDMHGPFWHDREWIFGWPLF